jgi:hypothetical protein
MMSFDDSCFNLHPLEWLSSSDRDNVWENAQWEDFGRNFPTEKSWEIPFLMTWSRFVTTETREEKQE